MWCEPQFTRFNERLKLDTARRGRIDSAPFRLRLFWSRQRPHASPRSQRCLS